MTSCIGSALAIGLLGVSASAAVAQTNAPSTVAGSPPGFNYPMTLEAVHADPKNHHVLYEDAHVRFLEVTLWPGDREGMHGHAYPSVFAFDAVQPTMDNDHMKGGGPPKFGVSTRPPGAPTYPRCETMGPQTPHAATVTEPYPQHFYRLEFKRLNGDADYDANWSKWYADAQAAGDRVLFSNAHVRLVDIAIPPKATERARGGALPAVIAFDTPPPRGAAGSDAAASPPRQFAVHPDTWNFPTCETQTAANMVQFTNTASAPLHYLRIEFKRVDGDRFATQWKRWYPTMAKGPLTNPPAT